MKKYYLSAIYDPLNPKAIFNPKEFRFILNKLNSISEKIFKMEVKTKLEDKKMDVGMASEFDFKTTQEVASLEEYLNGTINPKSQIKSKLIIAQIGSSDESEEKKTYPFHSTRIRETVDLAKKIAAELKDGKSYDEITKEFNQRLKNLGIDYRFKVSFLRKVISRAYRDIGKDNLKFFLGKV